MVLTGQELTAASSAVAALAIVGGYLGVRSANRNAVKIAREQRSSQRQVELEALKRVTYARCVAALPALNTASTRASGQHAGVAEISQRIDAAMAAHDAVVEVELIAPDRLRDLAFEALAGAIWQARSQAPWPRAGIKLRHAMRYDVQGADIPSPEELDRMADKAMSTPGWTPEVEQ